MLLLFTLALLFLVQHICIRKKVFVFVTHHNLYTNFEYCAFELVWSALLLKKVIFFPLLLGLKVSYFCLFSRNTKLYKTGHCFAEFPLFRETEKNTKIRKKCFELFSETEKIISFRCFAYFPLNFLPSLRISYLFFEFRTFCLSF